MSANSKDLAPLLIFGAHPDDIEFGCGGVVAQEVRAGRPVHMIVCSRGEAGTMGTPEIREAETRNAASILGASVEFIELDGDAHLRSTAEHAITLARMIREIRPGVVIAPSLVENQHPDHAQLGRLVRDSARLARFGGLSELKDLPPHAIRSLFYYALSLEAEPRDLSPVLVDVSSPKTLAAWGGNGSPRLPGTGQAVCRGAAHQGETARPECRHWSCHRPLSRRPNRGE